MPLPSTPNKEKKNTVRGCFTRLRTTIRSFISSRRNSKASPTFHVTIPSNTFSTPVASAAARPSLAADPEPAAAADPIYDSISQCSVESDLDQEPIPAYIRNICARLNQQPAMPLAVAAGQPQLLQLQLSRLLHPSPEVPEDPQPAAAASAMSDSTFWTGISIEKSHKPASQVQGGPVETKLSIKDHSARNSRPQVSLKIVANGTEISFTFKRATKSGGKQTASISADLDDYDTIEIEWNRECSFDLMELTEEAKVKCKFAGDRHFITLRNAEIYA